MMVRKPIVAGQFYPAGAQACREELDRFFQAAAQSVHGRPGVHETRDDHDAPPGSCVGGLVPHAGWTCSGAVASRVFAALARQGHPEVIVLFGGVHRYRGRAAAVFGSGCWETPLGRIDIDEDLASLIRAESDDLFADDAIPHRDEHSLEVQMPMLRHVFPDAKVVPIMVPIDTAAVEIGRAVGRVLTAYGAAALVVGTTDLTHYGPRYGFIPRGVGASANAWAKCENDRRFVDLVCTMKAERLVAEATARRNACNSGAAAATVTASASLGASRGVLLEHTTSAEVLAGDLGEDQTDSVGYAGIVFEK